LLVELDEDESGCELLLFGELLVPLLLPLVPLLPEAPLPSVELPPLLEPGDSEPPVAEPGLTPKNVNTLCLQLGWEVSELALNVGADCSLLLSPLKVNAGPIAPAVDEDVLLELALAGRNRIHGTATSFPEAPGELDVSDVLDVAEDELLVPAPELLSEIMAKSTLPELGLITTSWMVPSVSPEEP
jgi:hypothetical protein